MWCKGKVEHLVILDVHLYMYGLLITHALVDTVGGCRKVESASFFLSLKKNFEKTIAPSSSLESDFHIILINFQSLYFVTLS